MPLASSKLSGGVIASGNSLLYTAPEGSVVTLQSIVVCAAAGNLNFSLTVLPSGTLIPGGSDPYLVRNKLLTQYDSFVFGWGLIELGSGESLYALADSGTMDISVFGKVVR